MLSVDVWIISLRDLSGALRGDSFRIDSIGEHLSELQVLNNEWNRKSK